MTIRMDWMLIYPLTGLRGIKWQHMKSAKAQFQARIISWDIIMKYAQGVVSREFKELLKVKLAKAKTEAQLAVVLNEIHDAALECRNNPNGMRAAVELLKG